MDDQLTVGSLFAGVGGFDLGFERAGMRTVWFCEQDPYCQRVLARHWPGVPCFPDVRALVADTDRGRRAQPQPAVNGAGHPEQHADVAVRGQRGDLSVPVPYVDVLCGGFPCQDISLAGKGAGIGGARSGLWGAFARLIGELRPRYVVVENVPAITSRGLDVVLGDLAACGFDAEWDHLPAAAFGAPHRRDRFWLVAYPSGGELRVEPGRLCGEDGAGAPFVGVDGAARAVADPATSGLPLGRGASLGGNGRAEPQPERRGGPLRGLQDEPEGATAPGWWAIEPDVGRVAYGVPHRVDRLRALGNSLVPQIAEFIGRRIVDWERT